MRPERRGETKKERGHRGQIKHPLAPAYERIGTTASILLFRMVSKSGLRRKFPKEPGADVRGTKCPSAGPGKFVGAGSIASESKEVHYRRLHREDHAGGHRSPGMEGILYIHHRQ